MITLNTSATYLIVGESVPEEILKSVEPIDLIVADATNLGVKDLRLVLNRASQSPLGDRRLLVIVSAENLSEVMQNTLLKVLEEPYDHLTVVVQTRLKERLLPTVRSRLSVLNNPEEVEQGQSFEMPKLEDLQGYKDRPSLKAALEDLRRGLSQQLGVGKDSAAILENLAQIEKARNRLDQNCNQKLVLDSLLLHWADVSGKEKSGDTRNK